MPFSLETPRLRVEVAEPGESYSGSRFDWSAFITQVTLDGRHAFCAPEARDGSGTGGGGLCNEWGIFRPIGFDGIEPGEQFPKLGVGLLTRPDDEPYSFARPYEIEPFDIDVSSVASTSQGQSVTFTTEPWTCNGVAARITKVLAARDNTLRISYEIENVGEKPISTHEYNHNFVSLGGAPIGPGYTLRVPFAIHLEEEQNKLLQFEAAGEGTQVLWKRAAKGGALQVLGGIKSAPACWWELSHESGLRMREELDARWSRLSLYWTGEIVSPEMFVDVDVAPGKTQKWTRSYAFDSEA